MSIDGADVDSSEGNVGGIYLGAWLQRFSAMQQRLRTNGSTKCCESFDDLGGPERELVVAKGAVVGLEDDTEQMRVDARKFCVAPDFDRLEALQLGDSKSVNSGGDGMPLDRVGEDEGEVALDGLVTREIVSGDFFERELVEFREIKLGEEDGLA